MKVLQVNCVYNNGSTGKIVYEIHRELTETGVDSVVCYGRGARVHEPRVYKTAGELYAKAQKFSTFFSGIMYGGCLISTGKLISIIKKETPDIVHLHCINGYFVNIYRLVSWLKKNKIKTVLTLHAEFMYTGGCGHALDCDQWRGEQGCGNSGCPRWRQETKSKIFDRTGAMWKKMKKAFDGFYDCQVVSVSPWLCERAKVSPILRHLTHSVVMNGVETKERFHPYSASDIASTKKELGIGDGRIVFQATPYFSDEENNIKGGRFLIELARKIPEVTFVIAGSSKPDMDIPSNMVLLGRVNDQKRLALLYSMADLTVLTSKKETFSMVTAESLCCGTPVVGFEAGAPEMIAISEYSQFVPYGDGEKLLAAVKSWLGKKEGFPQLAVEAQKNYSISAMTGGYMAIYQRMIQA